MSIQFINLKNKQRFVLLFSLLPWFMLSACQTVTPGKKAQPVVTATTQASYQEAVRAMKSGHTRRALQLFNYIHKKFPGFAGPQLNIGLMYLKKNNLSKAEKAFKQAIKINRDNAIGYNLLGVVYRRSGKFNEAQEQYQLAIAKDPHYANAHLNLGVLYDLYMGDLKQAIYYYEKYQSLSKTADNQVSKWILDLKRRNKKTQTSKVIQQRGKRG